MRISSSAKIYPEHCEVLTISEADKTIIAASDLLTAIQAAITYTAKAKVTHEKALQFLTAIIENTPNATSTDATSPRVIQKTPSVHQQRTRRNTPMPTINEVNKPNR